MKPRKKAEESVNSRVKGVGEEKVKSRVLELKTTVMANKEERWEARSELLKTPLKEMGVELNRKE